MLFEIKRKLKLKNATIEKVKEYYWPNFYKEIEEKVYMNS